jgi:hypothetical protein
MRQRREVAAGSDAALRRDKRHGVGINQALQRFDYQRPHARISAPKTEQFQDDHQPGNVARERIAQACAVRQDQVRLKLGQPFVRNTRVGQQAEAGVDPVNRLAASNDAVDRRGRLGDALNGGIVETRLSAEPEPAQVVERDSFGVELHLATIGKSNPCSRAQSTAMS